MTHSSSQTAKQVFIRDLKENQQINDIFLVSRFNLAETKAGKPYLALGLMDKSGEIEARLWDRAEQLASLAQEGSFVAVQATVDQFNGQLQLKLLTLATASEETLALNDFFPTSRRPQKEMLLELKKRIKSIQDDPLRRLMATIFKGDTLARGERYGLIRFGSRVDLYLPPDYSATVTIGDVVTAGESILARTFQA